VSHVPHPLHAAAPALTTPAPALLRSPHPLAAYPHSQLAVEAVQALASRAGDYLGTVVVPALREVAQGGAPAAVSAPAGAGRGACHLLR
jgi:hypothetical protein